MNSSRASCSPLKEQPSSGQQFSEMSAKRLSSDSIANQNIMRNVRFCLDNGQAEQSLVYTDKRSITDNSKQQQHWPFISAVRTSD